MKPKIADSPAALAQAAIAAILKGRRQPRPEPQARPMVGGYDARQAQTVSAEDGPGIVGGAR